MGREDPQLKLRLTEEMKAAVSASAKANGRSVNAEIVAMIEAAQDGGGAEAARLKILLQDEREAFKRVDKMVNQQMDMLFDYRDMVRRANNQVFQQAKIIESLCYIVNSLEAAPTDDILAVTERMLTAAQAVQADFAPTGLEQARDELKKNDSIIRKAEGLLKKPDA